MLVSLPTFTLIHVVLSLFGIFAGLVVAGGLMGGVRSANWTALFLVTVVLTNVTGFFFPFSTVLPSHIVGAISLVILPIAIVALYVKHLAGGWRTVFVVTSVLALWLDVFVLLAQLFQKIPALAALAPAPGAPAFAFTQSLVLAVFVVIGWTAVRRFQPEPTARLVPAA